MKKYLRPIVFVIVFFSVNFSIYAATKTASVTGSWNNTATWGGAAVPVSTDNIVINSFVNVDITTNVSITNITINANGALQCGNSSTVTVLGTISGAGSYYGGTTSTVNFNPNSGSITIPSTWSFANISIASGKTVTAPPGTLTLYKDFTNNGTFIHNGGTVNYNSTAYCTVGGSSTTTFNNITGNYLHLQSTNTIVEGNLSINVDGTAGTTITFNGNTTISSTGFYGYNNIVINAGKTLTSNSSITYPLNVKGNFTNNGTFNHNGGAVNFNGTSVISGSSITNFNKVLIASGNSLDLGGLTIGIAGDFTNDGTFTHSNGKVVFNGSANQTYSGTGSLAFYDLEINNSVPGSIINLSTTNYAIDVSNSLTLTSGILTVNAGQVNVTSTSLSAVGGTYSNSWVNAKLKRGVNTGAYDYPVGSSSNLELLTLNITSIAAASDITASFNYPDTGAVPNLSLNCQTVNSTLDAGYWALVPNGGIGAVTYDVTLNERGHANSAPNASYYTLIERNNTSSAWYLPGTQVSYTQTEIGGTATAKRSGLTNFGEVSIGKATNALLNAGSVDTAQTICYNTVPSSLTQSVAPTGGSGSYTYQWQSSADNVSFSNISGATTANYSPPSLTASTYYKREVTSGACGSDYNQPILITVYGDLTSGSVGSAQSICSGTSPSVFTELTAPTGGSGAYTYQWQSSPDNSSWSNIAGATGVTYSSGSLTSSTYFRRSVASASCSAVYSSSFLVTVYSALASGSVGSAQTICSGSAPATFTELTPATGGNGSYSYQWQNSSNNVAWSNIAGATTITYSAPSLSASTYYRRTVSSGNCPSVNSASFLVTVNPLPQGSLTGNTFCSGGTGQLTWTASAGIGPFNVSYNGGSSETQNNVTSGTGFNSVPNPSTTTVFSLTSVTDNNGCIRNSGFTGANATITVETPVATPVSSSASNFTSTSFSANWTASSGATAYYLDVATDAGFTTLVSGYNNLNVGNVTTKSVTGLASCTDYYYRVRAANSCGISSGSSAIAASTIPTTPTSNAATNITASSFDANWTAVSGATNYYLDVSTTSGFSSFVSGYNNLNVGNITVYAVTGLSDATTYYYRVRVQAACGTSTNSSTRSLTTLCTTASVPYTESFDGISTPTLPNCWITENIDGGSTWVTSTTTASTAPNSLFCQSNPSQTNNDWAYSKGITLTAGTNYLLAFDYAKFSSGAYTMSLEVKYGNSASSGSMTNIIYSNSSISNTTFNTATVTFSPSASGTYYLGFHNITNCPTTSQNLYLDDISLTVVAPANDNCSAATLLYPNNICTNISATSSGATGSIAAINCGTTGNADDDVWFKFTATSTHPIITVTPSAGYNAVVDLRSGACNGTNIACVDAGAAGVAETINSTGLTVGSTYYVRVYEYGTGSGTTGNFDICITAPPLNTGTGSAIGTATTSNTSTTYPAPYGNYYESARHQFLIKASELTSAGISAGNLNSLAFNVKTVNGTALTNFTIGLGHTASASLTSTFISSGISTVYGPTTYTESVGWNTHTFDTPFNWNGSSNIVVDVCFYSPPYSNNAVTYYSAPGFTATTYKNADGSSQCGIATGTTSTNRPNMILGYSSLATNTVATYAFANNSFCQGDAVSISYTVTGTYTANTFTAQLSTDGGTTWSNIGSLVSNTDGSINATIPSNAATVSNALIRVVSSNPAINGSTNGTYLTINPLATVSAGPDQSICAGSTATMAGTYGGGASTGSWTTSGSGTFDNASATNAFYTPSGADISTGTVTLTFTTDDPSGPCASVSDAMLLTIDPAATVNAGSDQTICSGSATATLAGSIGGGATSAVWSGGAGTFSPNATTLNATYTPSVAEISAGTVTLTLTTDDPAGPCGTVIDQMVITINPTPATPTANSNSPLCSGSTLNLSTSVVSGASYSWTGPTGFTSTSQNPTRVVAATDGGGYTVYIIKNGCVSSAGVNSVVVYTLPTASAGANASVCSGSPIAIGGSPTASGGTPSYIYAWSPGATLSSTSTSNPTAMPVSTTDYTVTVTDANGCISVSSIVTITVNELPTSSTSSTPSCLVTCDGTATVVASGATAPYTYSWSPAGGTNSTATGLCAGTYSIDIWDVYGCHSSNTIAVANPIPLSGTYTVGGATPSYVTITDAVNDLVCAGISGNVIIDMRDGIYNEQLLIPAITGIGSNTITIQSESADSSQVEINYAGNFSNNYVVKFDGASNVILKRVTLKALNADYSRVVEFAGGSNNIQVSNSKIIGQSVVSSSSTSSVFYSDVSVESNITIENNLIQDGSSGIDFSGLSAGAADENIYVSGNTFLNQYYQTIYFNYATPNVYKNEIVTNVTNTGYTGIYLSQCNPYSYIKNNKITAPLADGNGIYVFMCNGDTWTPLLIANNFIQLGTANTTNGVFLDGSNYIDVFHNSVNITSTHPNYGRCLNTISGGFLRIRNNIFNNSGGGYCSYMDAPDPIEVMDNNDLYTTGSLVGNISNVDYTTLNDWQAATAPNEVNSISIDPQFVSSSDLHLTPGSSSLLRNGADLNSFVPYDIDEDTLRTQFPIIGADETSAVPVDFYWVGDGGNWSDAVSHWVSSSNGALYRATSPSSGENHRVYFDSNSFSGPYQIINMDVDAHCKEIQFNDVDNTPVILGSGVLYIGQ